MRLKTLAASATACLLAVACSDSPLTPAADSSRPTEEGVPDGQAAAVPKVDVCHLAPGTGNGKVISVSERALRAHLDHGDAQAVCLIITEIMYNPSTAQAPDSRGEYFELYNPGDEPVDLRSDFSIASSLKVTDQSAAAPDYFKSLLPTNPASYPLTVPPKAFAVVYDNGSSGSSVPSVFGPFPASVVQATVDDAAIGNGLNNGGDALALWVPDLSVMIDQVAWDGSLANGNGLSLQRCGPGVFIEAVPTAGAANACD